MEYEYGSIQPIQDANQGNDHVMDCLRYAGYSKFRIAMPTLHDSNGKEIPIPVCCDQGMQLIMGNLQDVWYCYKCEKWVIDVT